MNWKFIVENCREGITILSDGRRTADFMRGGIQEEIV